VFQKWFNESEEKVISIQSTVSNTEHNWHLCVGWQAEESDLLPYILHMDVVWARLISISSDRLPDFQCRMSVSFSASISLWAVLPCVAPCWTNDWMPRDAKYYSGELNYTKIRFSMMHLILLYASVASCVFILNPSSYFLCFFLYVILWRHTHFWETVQDWTIEYIANEVDSTSWSNAHCGRAVQIVWSTWGTLLQWFMFALAMDYSVVYWELGKRKLLWKVSHGN